MVMREASNPNDRPLFEVAVLDGDLGWITIAWSATRTWAEEIAEHWARTRERTVEVWLDGEPVARWDETRPGKEKERA